MALTKEDKTKIDKEFTSEYFVYYNDNNRPLAIYQEYAKDNTKAKPFLMI